MIENSDTKKMTITPNSRYSDEIDLKQIARALFRRKFLIASVAATTVICSGIYSLTRKPVWEGQFEIVLANRSAGSYQFTQLLNSNQGFSNLFGAGTTTDRLKTEIKILESPSVLKPVFDFVRDKKQQQGIDTRAWRFKNWVDTNLTIKLAEGTSVLELTYRDTEKDIVLPVIQKISEAYQGYSGRDRKQGIIEGIRYLDNQIIFYTEKSKKSFRLAQEYGIKYDLVATNGEGENDAEVRNESLNVEAIRIQAANQIRFIDEQLKQLDKSKSPEELIYIGHSIPGFKNQSLLRSIDNIDEQLARLRSNYTESDESIRRLLKNRLYLIDAFKNQTLGHLNAQRATAEARLKSAERPKGVLIKYRELLRNASYDEETLIKLETKRRVLSLEKARKQDPWELISSPTLLDSPVAPNKKRMVAFGLLAGLIAGSGAALLLDHRTGLVYSLDELKTLLPCSLIKHLPTNSESAWIDAADLLAGGPLAIAPYDSAIGLIPIGNIPSEQIQAFSAELRRALQGRELLVSTDVRQTNRCATQLLLTSPGAATRTQLSQLRQKLALQGTPVAGWVLLDPDLNLK